MNEIKKPFSPDYTKIALDLLLFKATGFDPLISEYDSAWDYKSKTFVFKKDDEGNYDFGFVDNNTFTEISFEEYLAGLSYKTPDYTIKKPNIDVNISI